jgi:hypothetical protein
MKAGWRVFVLICRQTLSPSLSPPSFSPTLQALQSPWLLWSASGCGQEGRGSPAIFYLSLAPLAPPFPRPPARICAKVFFFFFFFFWWDWGLNSRLHTCILAKQTLYHLSHNFCPFCFGYLETVSHKLFSQALP